MMEPYRNRRPNQDSNNQRSGGRRNQSQAVDHRGQVARQQQNNGNYNQWPSQINISGGRDIEQIHDEFRNNRGNNMIERMDKMQNQMFQGFGMGMQMKMHDPFKNDPFFNGAGGFGDMSNVFENANKMMSKMRNEMGSNMNGNMGSNFQEISSHMSSSGGNGLARGNFVKETYHKNGDHVYQTKAKGAFDGGDRVVDRQQMYENQKQNIAKASHERMLNDRGRKMVKEQATGNQRNFDHFRNMHSSDVNQFDQDWSRAAQRLGFNPGSNMLEYGGGANNYAARQPGPRQNNARAEAMGLGIPEEYAESRGLGYVDNSRRGHFIPDQSRGQNAPVRMGGAQGANRNQNIRQRQQESDARSIGPTIPGGRVEPMPARGAPNRNAAVNQPPRAIAARSGPIPGGGGAQARQARAAPVRAAPARMNNYTGQQRNSGPARAG